MQVLRRVAPALYAGLRYKRATVEFPAPEAAQDLIPEEGLDFNIGGLGLVAEWDSRNHSFQPNGGKLRHVPQQLQPRRFRRRSRVRHVCRWRFNSIPQGISRSRTCSRGARVAVRRRRTTRRSSSAASSDRRTTCAAIRWAGTTTMRCMPRRSSIARRCGSDWAPWPSPASVRWREIFGDFGSERHARRRRRGLATSRVEGAAAEREPRSCGRAR